MKLDARQGITPHFDRADQACHADATMKAPRSFPAWALALGVALAACGCDQKSSAAAPVPDARREQVARRDLSIDESMGGHTLARHVGKTDAELRDRLRREPQISTASTYTDRETAERSVGAAIAASPDRLAAWLRRTGRRPNLVLRYDASGQILGRSLSRGRRVSVACERALVVLRWHERLERYYVLTSYPETRQ